MSQPQGFIDLRIGHGATGIGDDSVWPSFTDIMTVIVMIFLMALVVIMVRNFDLDRELSSIITAKEATTLANQDLVRRLIQLEGALTESKNQREALQTNLNTVTGQRGQLQQANTLLEQQQAAARLEIRTLAESTRVLNGQIENLREQFAALELKSNEQISSLTSDNQSLSEKLDTVSAQLATVTQYLQQSQSALTQSEAQRQQSERELQQAQLQNKTFAQAMIELRTLSQNVEQRYSIASEQIVSLGELIEQRKAENAALQAKADASVQQYKSLQEEYQSLETKFRDLIRPARSTAGKQVAKVWIQNSAAGVQYKLKEPSQVERVDVEEQQLHEVLEALKEKYDTEFYVSIVIPENSGLSYGQAASLMDEIHRKYDYYFQQP